MRRNVRAAALTALVLAGLGLAGAASASEEGTPSTGTLPGAPGTPALNRDGEPGVAAAPDGRLWATAVNLGDSRPESQDVWTSTDGGSSWTWVAAPFNLVPGARALGANDADIAAATAPNALGRYNVYVAGLWVAASPNGLPEGDMSLAVSVDGGSSWVVHPLAGELPGDDRPWVVADGPCRVDLVYHSGPTVANVVDTYDLCDPVATAVGMTLTPIASTRYPTLAAPAALGRGDTYVTVGFGKPVVHDSVLYIPAMDCPGLTLRQEVTRAEAVDPSCPRGTDAEVYVEVGSPLAPGGPPVRWKLIPVARSSNSEVAVWPVTMAVDASGALYVAWHDNHDSFLSHSTDAGASWSTVQLNPSGAAVDPTVAANARGTVRVAWYGTTTTGDANDHAVMGPPGSPGSALWSLDEAVVTYPPGGPGLVGPPSTVDPAVHYGALCTQGDSCPNDGSRSLLDDFGIVHVPGTTSDVALYTSDQPGGGFRGDHVNWALLPHRGARG